MVTRPVNPPRKKDWENDVSWELIFVDLPFADGTHRQINIGKIERRHNTFIREITLCRDKWMGEYLYISSEPRKPFRHHHPRRVERDLTRITGMKVYDGKGDIIEKLFDGGQQ